MRRFLLWDLGFLDYEKAHRIQLQVHRGRVKGGCPDTLLLVEHPPVITLGKRGTLDNLLVSVAELRARGIGLHRVERGGDITYHGPGQLVGYPIFSIKGGLSGVRPFIRRLEQALIFALGGLGIKAEQRQDCTGVWVGDKKIAAIGVAVKRWVTFHGFALNVSADLTAFQLINPCGTGKEVTSTERVLGREVAFDEVKDLVRHGFEAIFNVRLVDERLKIEASLA
ncbi:MAG: lipoyl(octanoyl) transferase LipB [bacterium]